MSAPVTGARGNLAGILSGEAQIPAGQYLATVKSVRLRADEGISAEVVFQISGSVDCAGRLISERFALTGDKAGYTRRSKGALLQLAGDAGVDDLRDLSDLVGKQVRLSVLNLEGRRGEAVTRLVFPRPDGAWEEKPFVDNSFW